MWPDETAGESVNDEQAQRQGRGQGGLPGQEDLPVLADKGKQPGPALGKGTHQAKGDLVLTHAQIGADEENDGKVEAEETNEVQVGQAGHRQALAARWATGGYRPRGRVVQVSRARAVAVRFSTLVRRLLRASAPSGRLRDRGSAPDSSPPGRARHAAAARRISVIVNRSGLAGSRRSMCSSSSDPEFVSGAKVASVRFCRPA